MKGFLHRLLAVARHPIHHAKHASLQSFRSAQVRWTAFISKSWEGKGKIVSLISLKLVNYAFAAHLFSEHVGFVRAISGPSMEPTLGDHGEYVIENRLSCKRIARGDLVTLRSPLDPFRTVCKRVIGVAGDVICVDPTGVMAPSTEHVIVPKGHVWISGDNAAMSRDSREYGPVSTALVEGKLYARVWPLTKFKVFSNPTTFLD